MCREVKLFFLFFICLRDKISIFFGIFLGRRFFQFFHGDFVEGQIDKSHISYCRGHKLSPGWTNFFHYEDFLSLRRINFSTKNFLSLKNNFCMSKVFLICPENWRRQKNRQTCKLVLFLSERFVQQGLDKFASGTL